MKLATLPKRVKFPASAAAHARYSTTQSWSRHAVSWFSTISVSKKLLLQFDPITTKTTRKTTAAVSLNWLCVSSSSFQIHSIACVLWKPSIQRNMAPNCSTIDQSNCCNVASAWRRFKMTSDAINAVAVAMATRPNQYKHKTACHFVLWVENIYWFAWKPCDKFNFWGKILATTLHVYVMTVASNNCVTRDTVGESRTVEKLAVIYQPDLLPLERPTCSWIALFNGERLEK